MNYNKRFTLIELMVILSIISILTALIIPALKHAGKELDKTTCLNNQKQVGVGFISYTPDHNGYFPNSWYRDNDTRANRIILAKRFKVYNEFFGIGKSIFENKYLEMEDVFQCPSKKEYGSYASFDELPAWREFYDMDYADQYLGDKWLCTSYRFKIYEYEQVANNTLLNDVVNNKNSYRLNYPDRPMAADDFVGVGGIRVGAHEDGLNVLYQDGSVSFIADDTLYCSWASWEIRDLFREMRR